jgi:benzodiazapine receptor
VRIPIESSTSYRGRNSRPNWLALVVFLGLALCAGAVGAGFSPAFSPSSAAWYGSLVRPTWTAPDHWLAAVWMALYLTMGTSAWLVWRERYHRGRNLALVAYAVQLLLNAAWAPLLFGARDLGAGLLVMVALWVAVAWTLRAFATVRAAAAWLTVPYLGWLSFAVVLHLYIWRHNP